jgi:hypothetical protein
MHLSRLGRTRWFAPPGPTAGAGYMSEALVGKDPPCAGMVCVCHTPMVEIPRLITWTC